MTSPSSPPNRRRRRIVVLTIAVLSLVIGGGLWWSTRSKSDPRLVGTWIEDPDGPGFFGLRFHADGSQDECETLTNDRPNWTSVWKWSISGDVVTQRENARPTR